MENWPDLSTRVNFTGPESDARITVTSVFWRFLRSIVSDTDPFIEDRWPMADRDKQRIRSNNRCVLMAVSGLRRKISDSTTCTIDYFTSGTKMQIPAVFN